MRTIKAKHKAEYDPIADLVTYRTMQMEAVTDAMILFGYATPFNEPFIAYCPFVMNTREEIKQAYDHYNEGKFGSAPV